MRAGNSTTAGAQMRNARAVAGGDAPARQIVVEHA
jgi:hypothetical protein